MDFLLVKINSTGSSIVTICFAYLSLIKSIKDAMVVDLPEPVGPVTRTNPLLNSAKVSRVFGSPSSSNALI